MTKTNPTLESPALIKIEANQFHSLFMERKKDMKMEMENLARDRDFLKKEVDLLERTQKCMELEKCGVEEKLGRSERRCEKFEAKIKKLRRMNLNLKQKLNRSRKKCKKLRRKESEAEIRNSETNRNVDELRLKKMDSSGHLYNSRLNDLEPIVKQEKEEENLNTLCFVENGKVKKANEGDRDAMPPEIFWISDDSSGSGGIKASKKELRKETSLAQMLNENHIIDKSAAAAEEEDATLNIPEFDENGKQKANAGDGEVLSPEVCGNSDKSCGNIGFGLSAKGGPELVYCGTQGNGANVDFTHPGSKPPHISDVAQTECQGSVQHNEGRRLEVRGGRNKAYFGIEDEAANVVTYPVSKRPYVSNVAENNGSIKDSEVNRPENRGATFRTYFQRRYDLIKITNDIKKKLDKENLKKFEESCFGHLLKANEFTFQGQLIVKLLQHMDMNASNAKRLVFKINNSIMEFGPREFFHITGLRLGELETTTTTPYSTIHQSVFWGKPTISLKDIEEAFLKISTSPEGKGELTLKLALLNFLYATLLAKASNTKVEVQYLHLIEDLQKFNSFPWGQLAYEYLVSSILKARIRVDSRKAGLFSIHGFCDALQTWAYEMMPSVAAHCAFRLDDFEKITPCILRWSTTKVILSKDLEKFFAPVDLENTEGKKREETIAEEAKQKKRKFLCEGSDPVLPAQPLHHCTRVSQPVLDDNLPRNETPLIDDEETMKEAELPTTSTRHNTSDQNPISIDKATENLARSLLLVTERDGALSELANDNPVLDVPLLLWKENSEFYEISEIEASYERLLNRTKRLQLWISYAKFEAFGVKEKSDFSEKRKCLERSRAVFERGLSYFRTCAPELIEDRIELLEEWYKIEKYFGKLGDAHLVRAKIPRKLKKSVQIQNEDGTIGYVEHIEYLFPEDRTDDTFDSTSKM